MSDRAIPMCEIVDLSRLILTINPKYLKKDSDGSIKLDCGQKSIDFLLSTLRFLQKPKRKRMNGGR